MLLVARQPIHSTAILISPHKSLGPGNAHYMNFIYPQSIFIARYQGNVVFRLLLGNSILILKISWQTKQSISHSHQCTL